jgi:hypothetical protein
VRHSFGGGHVIGVVSGERARIVHIISALEENTETWGDKFYTGARFRQAGSGSGYRTLDTGYWIDVCGVFVFPWRRPSVASSSLSQITVPKDKTARKSARSTKVAQHSAGPEECDDNNKWAAGSEPEGEVRDGGLEIRGTSGYGYDEVELQCCQRQERALALAVISPTPAHTWAWWP